MLIILESLKNYYFSEEYMKLYYTFCSFAIVCICTLLPIQAHANLSLDKVVVQFTPSERPVSNVLVSNKGDSPIKVTAEIIEVLNSGTKDEKEIKTKNLIVAPGGFELNANESRNVRLVLRKTPEDFEKIYRIRFHPDTISFTEEVEKGNKSVRVGVIISMGILVIAEPKEPKPKLEFVRNDKKIIFSNNGNVTAQLQREDFCNKDRTKCTELTGKRIYPGSTWEMEIPEHLIKTIFQQTVLINGNYSTITYPVNSD